MGAGVDPNFKPLPEWFMVTVMTVISGIAVIANIIAIFCFMRFRKKLKQNTVAYLISLAVSDLWIGFMTGCGVLTILNGSWALGSFLCQGVAFLNNAALVNSLWTVALSSVDRCLAITIPFKHRSIITKNRLVMLILGTWAYSSILSFPPLVSSGVGGYIDFTPHHPWCSMSSRNKNFFVIFMVGFLPLPILIILVSYSVIFVTTQQYTKRQLERISGSSPSWRSLDNGLDHQVQKPSKPVLGAGDKIVRLSDEHVPLNISSSYDTLKVKQGSWPGPPPKDTQNRSFYKQVIQAVRSLLFWRSEQEERNGYRQRLPSVALSEEEAAARKLRKQAGTLLVVIGTTIMLCYIPIFLVAILAAYNYDKLTVTYSEGQGLTLLMLSNASINPLIYFLLNKEFRLAAKSIFIESALAMQLRRHSSTLLTRGSLVSQTTDNTSRVSHHDHQTISRQRSCDTEQTTFTFPRRTRHVSKEKTLAAPRSGSHSPSSRPASDPIIQRTTRTATTSSSSSSQDPIRSATEERIHKHVLRNSLLLLPPRAQFEKTGAGGSRRGLINLSFYEVESAL